MYQTHEDTKRRILRGKLALARSVRKAAYEASSGIIYNLEVELRLLGNGLTRPRARNKRKTD